MERARVNQTFLWLAMHDKLLTNAERVSRGLSNSSTCAKCNLEEESTIHVLRDCPFASWIWMNLLDQADWDHFFNLPLQEWLAGNLYGKKKGDWIESMGFTFWCYLLGALEMEK